MLKKLFPVAAILVAASRSVTAQPAPSPEPVSVITPDDMLACMATLKFDPPGDYWFGKSGNIECRKHISGSQDFSDVWSACTFYAPDDRKKFDTASVEITRAGDIGIVFVEVGSQHFFDTHTQSTGKTWHSSRTEERANQPTNVRTWVNADKDYQPPQSIKDLKRPIMQQVYPACFPPLS